jgi:hypothetical protein
MQMITWLTHPAIDVMMVAINNNAADIPSVSVFILCLVYLLVKVKRGDD